MNETRSDNPLVSIIVRTKDRPKLLRRALKSIADQTYRPIESILVNDGGCELDVNELQEILGDIKLNYTRLEENRGRAHAGNAGLRNAAGAYIGFLDDDDELYPDHVETLVHCLAESDCGVAYTDSQFVFQEWMIDRYVTVGKEVLYSLDFDRERLLIANYIPMPNVLFRKGLISIVGFLDEGLDAHEDWDLWIRFSRHADFRHVRKVTAEVSMRTDGSTLTSSNRALFLKTLRIIHEKYASYVTREETIQERHLAEWSLVKEVVNKGEELANSYLFGIAENQIGYRNTRIACLETQVVHLKDELMNREARMVELQNTLGEMGARISELEKGLCETAPRIVELERGLQERDRQIEAKDAVIQERDRQIEAKDAVIQERDRQIEAKDAVIGWRETHLLHLQSTLETVFSSRGWKLLRAYYRIRDSVVLSPFHKLRRFPAFIVKVHRTIHRVVYLCDGSPLSILQRVFSVFRRSGMRGVLCRARILASSREPEDQVKLSRDTLHYDALPPDATYTPKVSIIVPNFNHARYLRQRLESVYGQSYSNVEVILLDDCSTDESVFILKEYAARYPGKTICLFNDANSGGVFNQWKKGLELATGELVWIAESDDYCSLNLLEELVRFFQNPAVMLAFARSDFVRGEAGDKVWTSEEYLADLDLPVWDNPFIQSAHALVKHGWAIKNLVPNVSGAVFRAPSGLSLFDDPTWRRLRLCGDWMFYLTVVRGGLVAYSPRTTNYYRQHRLNTSVTTQNQDIYYEEFEIIARHLVQNYALDAACLERQAEHLYQHWCARRGYSREDEFRKLYSVERVWQASAHRKPNVVMAVYALIAGGGETFPIMLANQLYCRGYAVTLLNCCNEPTEPGIRAMLSRNIPLLELDRLDLLDAVLTDMGAELVHSHHAWVDVTLATLLANNQKLKHVCTMHGMYELMPKKQLRHVLSLLIERPHRFVYTAEKQLEPFPQEFRDKKKFCRIDNALPSVPVTPVARIELGIGEDDFVLCLVSRAMPEKGWAEAIAAVSWAHARSTRPVHLLLIGEGEEYERLRSQAPQGFVQFLGFRPNIRDYFATSDLGFLPSRFKGESFPLVLIDCLQAGKPFLASNIGEIRYMLETGEGLAGELFDLDNWSIPVETVGKMIYNLANDREAHRLLISRVPLAAAKFDPGLMVDKYEALYANCLAVSASDTGHVAMQGTGGRS